MSQGKSNFDSAISFRTRRVEHERWREAARKSERSLVQWIRHVLNLAANAALRQKEDA